MKKIIASTALVFFVLVGFTVKPTTKTMSIKNEMSIGQGKKLFKDKGCAACHQEKVKIIGPSLKDIAKKYKAKKGNIVLFLQGKKKAIVDTNAGQVAIMKTNFSVTKKMSAKDLKSISDYILSIK